MKKLFTQINKLPDAPGVYFFTRGKDILYIGKATSLRDRVRSYLRAEVAESRGGRIVQMLALATGVKHEPTASVLEALLLESELIKKHQPKYNAREKDDKSYWYIVVTKEDWPRVLMTRGQKLEASPYPLEATYGPFPNASELREALRLIRKILPYRDTCKPLSGKRCFNAQIGLCPGICLPDGKAGAGTMDAKSYRQRIRHLKLLLSGRVRPLVTTLTREMKVAAKRHDFERGGELRDQIRALTHIQHVGLIKERAPSSQTNFRIVSYDIAHLAGQAAVGGMTVMEDGELKKSDYRKFKVKRAGDDLANLREVLERRLAHTEWPQPNLIVVDGGPNQLKTIREVLAENKLKIPTVSVVKDERHKPKDILGDQKVVTPHRALILRLNHDTHNFAIRYHRQRLRQRV